MMPMAAAMRPATARGGRPASALTRTMKSIKIEQGGGLRACDAKRVDRR